jgi:hypothetical protein
VKANSWSFRTLNTDREFQDPFPPSLVEVRIRREDGEFYHPASTSSRPRIIRTALRDPTKPRATQGTPRIPASRGCEACHRSRTQREQEWHKKNRVRVSSSPLTQKLDFSPWIRWASCVSVQISDRSGRHSSPAEAVTNDVSICRDSHSAIPRMRPTGWSCGSDTRGNIHEIRFPIYPHENLEENHLESSRDDFTSPRPFISVDLRSPPQFW